jgi:hypothetical protein
MEVDTQQCPWCGSTISNEKFAEIQLKIRSEERNRLEKIELSLREKLSGEKEAAAREAANQVAVARADRDAALQKLKDVEAREEAIRKRAHDDAMLQAQKEKERELNDQRLALEAQLDATRNNLAEIQAREAGVRQEAREEALKSVHMTLETERQQKSILKAERDRTLEKLAEAEANESKAKGEVEDRLRLALEQAERQRQNALQEQRAVLEADRDQSVLKKTAEFAREREKWEKEILELQHRVKKETADQIGDGAEIDLFERLKEAFEEDVISRTKRGQPGPDFRHEVRHNGEICGTIIYDSKNRQDWKLSYATKLRQEQVEAQADHAILATTIFPSGKKELCLESEVIVVNPARTIPMVQLLRRALISMHVRGLSLKARAEKTEHLYAFINSSAYTQRFGEVGRLTEQVLDIDVDERNAHDAVWKRRGILLKRQSNLLRDLDTEISAIIEGTEASRKPAA